MHQAWNTEFYVMLLTMCADGKYQYACRFRATTVILTVSSKILSFNIYINIGKP